MRFGSDFMMTFFLASEGAVVSIFTDMVEASFLVRAKRAGARRSTRIPARRHPNPALCEGKTAPRMIDRREEKLQQNPGLLRNTNKGYGGGIWTTVKRVGPKAVNGEPDTGRSAPLVKSMLKARMPVSAAT